jgi:hypothetical protein
VAAARPLLSVPRASGEAPAPAPAPVVAAAVPDGGTGSDAGRPTRWRSVLRAAQNQRLKESDEIVFGQLGISDGQREAIRKINDDYSRRTELVAEAPDASARKVEMDRERRSALADLLGPDLGRRFESAESAVTIRLRGKYRRESGKMMMQR